MSTELIEAIKKDNNKQAIKLIDDIQNKDDFSIPDNSGRTALHWAAIKNNTTIFKALLNKLPKAIKITDNYGIIPIHIAAAKNFPEIIKLSISKYPNKIIKLNNDGSNVLHIAAANRSWAVIDTIFSSLKDEPLKILINQRDNNGTNPLGIVLLNHRVEQNIINNVIKKFLGCKNFKVNEYLNNKKGMDIFADEHLLKIGGFNLLHYALKEKFTLPITESFINELKNHKNINFFYPAQNPKFHMCSPNKILQNTAHDKKSRESLTSMLQTAQKTQKKEQNAYTDGDSDTDSDDDHSDAYIWKHVLLDMISTETKEESEKYEEDEEETSQETSQETKYVVPLFHGVPFMTNLYTHADRNYVGKKMMLFNYSDLQGKTQDIIKEHLKNIEEEANADLKAIYSRTSTASAGVANMSVIAQDDQALAILKKKNDELKEDLKKAYKADISNNKAVFHGIVLDFVNQFQDKDGATQKAVWSKIIKLNNNLSHDIIKYRFPFISTSKTPDHAVRYGFGINLEDKRGEDMLNPEYNKYGCPKHRLAGLVYVIQEDATSLETSLSSGEIFDVCSLRGPKPAQDQNPQKVNPRFSNQIELAYLAGVDADKVLAIIPLVYPNFSKKFVEGYHNTVYGYTSDNYPKGQTSISINELKNIFIKYIDKIANKFTDGELVTFFPKDDNGYFKFAKYDTETEYNISNTYSPEEDNRNTSLNHGMLTVKKVTKKGTTARAYVEPELVPDLSFFQGNGLLDYEQPNYWHTYTNAAMDNILKLRLEGGAISKDIDIFSPRYVFDGSSSSATKLFKDISEKIDDTLLVNLNLYNKHWVGIAIDKSNHEINLHYMDPEQQEMPVILKEQLENALIEVYPHHQISLVEDKFKAQKYNNCGPEVIENFMSYLTGDRLSQEDALPVHSLLFEDIVMLEGDYSCT